MSSKEALEIIELILNNHSNMLEVNDKRNECLNVIKQDIERLEKLEIENRNNEKVIKDSVKLINKNLELKERLEVLEIENEQLKGNEDIVSNYAYGLKEENEKLKKAIEYEIELLIERRFNAYACDNYEVYNVIDAIIEELKEVLGE